MLNIYAEQMHLVPPTPRARCAGACTDTTPSPASAGGHIGIYVSGRAQREVPATIDGWLKSRDL